MFAQLIEGIHPQQFRRCVQHYGGDRKVRRFSCWDQFLAMSFAQLTYRESLRDIEACLRSRSELLYHLGSGAWWRAAPWPEANETRDWRIYADLAQKLIVKDRRLYANEQLGLELEETVYAFDSTTIDLCLSLFPWAHFRKRKGAIKLHTLLDLRGPIPPSSRSPRESATTSTYWIRSSSSPAPFTSWTGVISTLLACMSSIKLVPTL